MVFGIIGTGHRRLCCAVVGVVVGNGGDEQGSSLIGVKGGDVGKNCVSDGVVGDGDTLDVDDGVCTDAVSGDKTPARCNSSNSHISRRNGSSMLGCCCCCVGGRANSKGTNVSCAGNMVVVGALCVVMFLFFCFLYCFAVCFLFLVFLFFYYCPESCVVRCILTVQVEGSSVV